MTFDQTTDGDLKLVRGRLVKVTDPAQIAAIKIKNRLRFFKGEWFADTRLGTPWFSVVFVKAPDLAVLAQMFRLVLLSVPEVTEIVYITLDHQNPSRELLVDFEVKAGETRITGTGGSGTPFIVEVVEQ